MKADIHPNYNDTLIKCACGFETTIGSTMGEEVHVEICSNCHPFYTGKQKLIDTAGRIDKFNRKFQKAQAAKAQAAAK